MDDSVTVTVSSSNGYLTNCWDTAGYGVTVTRDIMPSFEWNHMYTIGCDPVQPEISMRDQLLLLI